MAEQSFLALLKRAIELAMPDLRTYYRMTRKAKVVASYASDGKYFADVIKDSKTVLWNGPMGVFEMDKYAQGSVAIAKAMAEASYYDGDPNYPRISNFRWQGNTAPECDLDELIIQQTPGVSLKILKDGSFLTVSPKDWTVEIGGNATIKASGNATVEAAGTLTLAAPQIIKQGNETCTGSGGGTGTTVENANRTTNGSITINGNLVVNGNSYATSRSGGPCPH